jgi:hypothetical protein
MKKTICLLTLFFIALSVYAFDRSLDGSWGLIMDNKKEVFIRFNYGNKEIIIMDTVFRSKDYEEADDTLYFDDFDGDSVLVQYYRLTANKLLFILCNTDDPSQSLTMILTKF